MPLYTYRCPGEHGEFDQFFKSLPSEAKQKSFPCPECDAPSQRLLGSFMVGGTQSGEIEKSMGTAVEMADIGGRQRPVFRDANGRMHEIKSMFDVSQWKKSNQLGKPRMVQWHNPKTGEKSWVPQRVKMIADPVSGEPMDAPVIRESVEMVEVDHFEMPSETKTGIPLDPKTGTPIVKDISKAAPFGCRGLIDPATNKPMSMGDVWGNEKANIGPADRGAARARLNGKQGMSRSEVAQRLASEL